MHHRSRLLLQHSRHYHLYSVALIMTLSSASIVQGIAEGTPAQGTPLICDVRDVARAHVLAAENPRAAGRYIVSHRAPLTASALSKALQVKWCCPLHSSVPAQQRSSLAFTLTVHLACGSGLQCSAVHVPGT